jgi:hypothetical protein
MQANKVSPPVQASASSGPTQPGGEVHEVVLPVTNAPGFNDSGFLADLSDPETMESEVNEGVDHANHEPEPSASAPDIKTFSAAYMECELLRRQSEEAKTKLDALTHPDAIGVTLQEMRDPLYHMYIIDSSYD